jgi:hypothetical protein
MTIPDVNTHRMVLGNNVKNLVILIPNEAHESTNQPRDQYPLANQPYLPQNAVVNVGTAVSFNDTGTHTYFEKDVNEDDPAFVMNGTISVIYQPDSLTSSTSGSSIDTVGVLMVPTQGIH